MFVKRNLRLFVALAAVIAALGFMTVTLNNSTVTCMGIASSPESIVSFERPVQIKRIFVRPGEQVVQGQLLLELSQSKLELEYMQVETRLKTLQAEQSLAEVLIGKKTQTHLPDPASEEINGLQEQLQILNEQKDQSFIFAETNGLVGSVNFQVGENVSPFTPILSITPHEPTSVNAFVHESLHHQIEAGDQVLVRSESDPEKLMVGFVTNVGSRIVEFPERLLKFPGRKVWGKEIFVQLKPSNDFLQGERVQVSKSSKSKIAEVQRVMGKKATNVQTDYMEPDRQKEIVQ